MAGLQLANQLEMAGVIDVDFVKDGEVYKILRRLQYSDYNSYRYPGYLRVWTRNMPVSYVMEPRCYIPTVRLQFQK